MPRLKVDTDVDMSEPMSKRQLQTCIARLAGPYEVTLKPIDPKRTNPQNRYFWRVVCQTLAEWFTENGQPMTKDQAKALLCEEFLPVTFTDPVTGEVKTTPGSTSGLDVPAMTDFLELSLDWMALHNIELPPPPDMGEGRQQTRTRQPAPEMN